jgi:hypothetical protein
MKTRAKRTLVKSAPELWELADDQARMEAWMAGLIGSPAPVPVEVIARRPQRSLEWRVAPGGEVRAGMAIQLAEKGFGTSVSITADHPRPGRDEAEVALERLLDELGAPARRPFSAV